jgi:hypothetical protein
MRGSAGAAYGMTAVIGMGKTSRVRAGSGTVFIIAGKFSEADHSPERSCAIAPKAQGTQQPQRPSAAPKGKKPASTQRRDRALSGADVISQPASRSKSSLGNLKAGVAIRTWRPILGGGLGGVENAKPSGVAVTMAVSPGPFLGRPTTKLRWFPFGLLDFVPCLFLT